jgi:hypothetical protein
VIALGAAGGLAGCGKKGDPKLPDGVSDTMPFPRQYPSVEVPPPAAEPEAQ